MCFDKREENFNVDFSLGGEDSYEYCLGGNGSGG